jgi:NADH:ubiquinone oxidoreductase subunit F (NADH-binding)
MTPPAEQSILDRHDPIPARGASGDASQVPRLLWPRNVPVDPSLEAHLRRHGPPPPLSHDEDVERLWSDVSQAGILGRGGAGFPLFRKMRAVPPGVRTPVIVANGTEGEPASDKDRVLLLQAPHLVFDGISAAASLIGAGRAFLVVPEEVLPVVVGALDERPVRRGVPIQVVRAAAGFVAGEASAVVSWIERGCALPRVTPPRLTESGIANRPTLVQNVETLAHLALVARHGAEWYCGLGTPDEPGSMLVTLSGAFVQQGVHEVPIGMQLGDLVALGGARLEDIRALLIGGYSAAWVDSSEVAHLRLSRASLRPAGASPGAGIVVALPRERCGLVESARVLRYLAGQSAGQCGPCVFGLDSIAQEFERLARTGRADLTRLHRWIGQVDGRGACAHPDGAARFARSALHVFADEVESHLTGWCSGTSIHHVLPIPESEVAKS